MHPVVCHLRKDIIWDSHTTKNHYCINIRFYSLLVVTVHVSTLFLCHLQAYTNIIYILNYLINYRGNFAFFPTIAADQNLIERRLISSTLIIYYQFVSIGQSCDKMNCIIQFVSSLRHENTQTS
jgi:hypothetical protein